MNQPATYPPLTPRERLRWRRAMDALLIDAIFGRVVRDEAPPDERSWTPAAALAAGADPAVAVA